MFKIDWGALGYALAFYGTLILGWILVTAVAEAGSWLGFIQ